jgi:hypothetical protein
MGIYWLEAEEAVAGDVAASAARGVYDGSRLTEAKPPPCSVAVFRPAPVRSRVTPRRAEPRRRWRPATNQIAGCTARFARQASREMNRGLVAGEP